MTTASNMVLLRKDDDDTFGYCNVIVGDHYITTKHQTNTVMMKILTIFSREHGDKLDSTNIPKKNSKI